MDANEYELIQALMERNLEMRIIAVGDDDQNIYEFRGSDSKYFQNFLNFAHVSKYELIENYRSKNNLVEFANQFAECIEHRIKENNVRSVEKLNGKIKIVQYSSNHLIYPLVKTIINADLSGSTCILTRTNDEALYITGLLNKFKVNAKLIQSNDGFNLSNLQEIRFIKDFLSSNKDSRVIPEEKLDEVRGEIKERFNGCHALPICLQILKTFERTYPKTKYKSDFDVFVGESMIEDFIDEGNDTILVSTMHKAKGKEFENVFILLNQYDLSDDAARRLLYVAITSVMST